MSDCTQQALTALGKDPYSAFITREVCFCFPFWIWRRKHNLICISSPTIHSTFYQRRTANQMKEYIQLKIHPICTEVKSYWIPCVYARLSAGHFSYMIPICFSRQSRQHKKPRFVLVFKFKYERNWWKQLFSLKLDYNTKVGINMNSVQI